MQHVAIIDYGSGNLHSAAKAFERAARDSGSDSRIVVTSDPEVVRAADRVVLPGVGAFADCRRGLEAVAGLHETLEDVVRDKGRPFLGICVGMQLLATRGLEHGVTQGLGWIAGEVRAIEPKDPKLKIPHMGWNTLTVTRDHPLLAGLPTGPQGLHAYFVHSYHFVPESRADVVAETEYGGPVTALVAHDNVAGTQFHPEKSQTLGLGLIANFLRWMP
ncbi:MAG: imidazole glycerol phosphate synthase subunit HisH [Hyphomicrobium sp.]|nr:imidazole glycerol phosphate synthase subunit HisH [Hyphomicrobium sp.]